ncbi:MAG: S1 RNA-binding domain-containing protein [Chloroflexi bacterium]|nr:S1 RNA-binding domain-containing protein [Chloroflexota bacterium]
MEPLKDTLEEAYWLSLIQDEEASGAAPAANGRGRPPTSEAGAAARPIDVLWASAQRACDADEALTVEATGFNRGGLLVDWQGLHGFVPSSHLIGMPAVNDEDQRKAEFGKRVGQHVHGKIIELDRARGRFVLSERLAYNDRTRLEMLMTDMQPGQRRCGVVTTVCDFGVFIDLGGLEGLAHISEISWGRINHPGDVLHSGQNVDVYVMNVDRAQRRVALSVKRLLPDPWATVAARYQLGQLVEGLVTTVVDFGAFVRLEEGVEGLIHISELAEGNFLHPRNVVREDETVRVKVLNVDVAHRRLGLSLRQVQDSLRSAEAETRTEEDTCMPLPQSELYG